MSIFAVYLRKPNGFDDRRNDPFWEFGSFGMTGCHSRNLLNPRTTHLKDGDQLAFLQGGQGEIRIVGLSPPIRVCGTTGKLEIRWDPDYRPAEYSNAALLINNEGMTDFPSARRLIEGVRRSTFCGKAGSMFRSRTRPVDIPLASEIVAWFADNSPCKVEHYVDAIQPADGEWRKWAIERGWVEPEERASSYRSVGGDSSASLG